MLRVVPLFETLDDLENAPSTMTTLFSSEWYLAHINGLQECMIGERPVRLSCPAALECAQSVPLRGRAAALP
jgi:hypothetical protein